jgi:hypothetical protein
MCVLPCSNSSGPMVITLCGCVFHSRCLGRWTNASCPIVRGIGTGPPLDNTLERTCPRCNSHLITGIRAALPMGTSERSFGNRQSAIRRRFSIDQRLRDSTRPGSVSPESTLLLPVVQDVSIPSSGITTCPTNSENPAQPGLFINLPMQLESLTSLSNEFTQHPRPRNVSSVSEQVISDDSETFPHNHLAGLVAGQ